MQIRLLLACLILTVSLNDIVAQDINANGGSSGSNFVVTRTEWGHPDLQGVWNFNSETPMQRPERYGSREFLTRDEIEQARIQRTKSRAEADAQEAELVTNPEAPPAGAASTGGYNNFWYESASIGENIRTSLIIYPTDGRIPQRVEGSLVHTATLGPDVPGERPVRAIFGGIGKDGPEDRGLSERCLIGFNAGPPLTGGGYNANIQIVQNRDHVVVLTEMVHDARIVPLNDRPPIDDGIRLWTGDSRGHWEGDTLVVTSRNFSELMPSFSRYGTAKDKSLTERFTRISPSTIEYQWTLEDPSTFTDKITAVLPMTKVAGQLYEYGCHEGNYGMENLLRGERMSEMRAANAESGQGG